MKEEIMDRLMEALKEKTGAGCDIEFSEMKKNNGVTLQAVVFKEHGKTVFPTVYIDRFIDGIEQCGTGIQEAAEEIVGIYDDGRNREGVSDIVQTLDKEYILKRVTYQVVGKEKNADMLADVPHKELLDLAVVYRVIVDENNDETLSFLVSNFHCREYGISSEELERAAMRNTEMRGFKTVTMASIMAEYTGIPKEITEKECPPTFVLTNAVRHNGAAVLLYWNYLDKLAHKLQSDLYILPSSVHEVIAIPAGLGSPRELREMVMEINAGGTIAEDEILSNSVYLYSLKKGGLYIA